MSSIFISIVDIILQSEETITLVSKEVRIHPVSVWLHLLKPSMRNLRNVSLNLFQHLYINIFT